MSIAVTITLTGTDGKSNALYDDYICDNFLEETGWQPLSKLLPAYCHLHFPFSSSFFPLDRHLHMEPKMGLEIIRMD